MEANEIALDMAPAFSLYCRNRTQVNSIKHLLVNCLSFDDFAYESEIAQIRKQAR
jgi:hypothetical protein